MGIGPVYRGKCPLRSGFLIIFYKRLLCNSSKMKMEFLTYL